MEKLSIQNRKGQKVLVVVEQPEGKQGLAFVTHGLGGFKEQPHIRAMAEAFLDNGYTTVTFDTTNSIGKSDGKYEDATTTNYYEDLEDVIAWAKSQPWYHEPFCLAGHSLGGICMALFAQKFPKLVKALAPIATVVLGKLRAETLQYRTNLKNWQKTGWLIKSSMSKPGMVKRLPWSHMEDCLRYDLLPKVRMLTMPMLMIVGSEDQGTPPEHQKILFDFLPGRKEMHIIQGAPHTFRDPQHLKELKVIIDHWLKSLR